MVDELTEAAGSSANGRSPKRLIALGLVTLLLAAAGGVGGYLVGRSTGEDLDAARAAGEVAGHKAGTAKGSREGYAEGFEAGRERGYEETYADAYREAYAKAYEKAGLEAPKKISIPAEQ